MDSKKNYVVAVDIGSSEVVIAVGVIAEGGTINIEALVSEPVSGVTAGLVDNSQTVAEALRFAREKAEQEVGVAITDAYVSISGNFVRCARFSDHVFVEDSDNRISQRDLAALRERMRNVKAPDGEVIMDLFPLCYKNDVGAELKNPVGCYSKQLSSTYNFILCDQTAQDRLRRVFMDAGIKIRGIYAGAAIVAESLVTSDEKEEGVAVVDIGSGVTDVAIYRGGVLCYIASIPMGGSAVNQDIKGYDKSIPSRMVENLKRQCGSAVVALTPDDMIKFQNKGRAIKPIPRLNLAAVIEARMTDIVEYVWNEIRDAGYAKKLGTGIVLTGGESNLRNVDELFRRITEQEVRVACAEIGISTESLEHVASPSYALAVSLLLRGAQTGACPVGVLIPKKVEPTTVPTSIPTPTPAPTPTPTPTPAPAEPQIKAEPQPAPAQQRVVNVSTMPTIEESDYFDNGDDIADEEDEPKKKGGWFKRLGSKLTQAISNAFPEPGEDVDGDDEY